MEVKVLRLDRSFPAGPIGESLGPHTSLDSFLELVDETTRLEMQKFRFLDDARRKSSSLLIDDTNGDHNLTSLNI